MKIFIFLSLVFFQLNSFSQNPIQVIITESCSPVSGTYLYTGIVNNKNNYAQTFLIEDENVTVAVGYDGTKWVLYANNDLTDPGFINIATNGLLPPLTGWSPALPDGCENGTMVISTSLATYDFEELANKLTIYPNPSSDEIIISNLEENMTSFEFVIFDVFGRIIKNGNSSFNSKISLSGMQNGSYVLNIKLDDTIFINKKFIKN